MFKVTNRTLTTATYNYRKPVSCPRLCVLITLLRIYIMAACGKCLVSVTFWLHEVRRCFTMKYMLPEGLRIKAGQFFMLVSK